ncbi:hypothetical protein ACLVWU_12775 [Bdellovibrio sp. HCB290]|uniref:hypothetical protein n=1 Tax=Bdellovibrio sp. HCB290 TaxID=3394356 RepID=UPI0039B618BF
MKRLKLSILALIGLVLTAVFPSRYLSNISGIATTSIDYGVHLNISTHIRNFDIFPQSQNDQVGKHAVSKYLPIYHGLLGFHVLAAALEFIGIPLPGAYCLLIDISFLLILVVLLFMVLDNLQKQKSLEAFIVLTIAIPILIFYFIEAMKAAFFSQLLSQALVFSAIYLYKLNRNRAALCLLLYAGFCYPDFIIWFFPILFFSEQRFIKTAAVVLSPAWLVLMFIPFSRSHLAGSTPASQIVFYSTAALTLLNIKSLWRDNRTIAIATLFFIIYALTFTLGTMSYFTPTYYASKISSFSYFILPILLLSVPILSNFASRLMMAILLLLLLTEERPWVNRTLDYFAAPSFTNQDYKDTLQEAQEADLQTNGVCRHDTTYLLPSPEQNSIAISARYGTLANFDIYSLNLNSKGMNQIFQSNNGSLGAFLQMPPLPHEGILELKKTIESFEVITDFCLGVPEKEAAAFAESQSFEKLYAGAHFVYFKPKKP